MVAIINPVISLKELAYMFRVYSHTLVLYANQSPAINRDTSNLYGRSRPGVFYGVTDQVVYHLTNLIPVGIDHGWFYGVKYKSMRRIEQDSFGFTFLNQVSHVEWLFINIYLSGFQPGDI